jgi:hypothetical protein
MGGFRNKRNAKKLAVEENERARAKQAAVNASLRKNERIQEALWELWKEYEQGKEASQITQKARDRLWQPCAQLIAETDDTVQSEIDKELRQTMEETFNAARGNFALDDLNEHGQKVQFGKPTTMTYDQLKLCFSDDVSTGFKSIGTTGDNSLSPNPNDDRQTLLGP